MNVNPQVTLTQNDEGIYLQDERVLINRPVIVARIESAANDWQIKPCPASGTLSRIGVYQHLLSISELADLLDLATSEDNQYPTIYAQNQRHVWAIVDKRIPFPPIPAAEKVWARTGNL